MSEPNVLREIQAGLDNAPELSEADYEAMEAAERKRTMQMMRDRADAAWLIRKRRMREWEQANNEWSDLETQLREYREKWGDL